MADVTMTAEAVVDTRLYTEIKKKKEGSALLFLYCLMVIV